ncbi:hypothetical protein LWI28_012736 [Acer negundo]|uniref:Uncharacterized protein n=1 Tax=Acer negundo TaxID=4023 RepID=A0AAD5IEU1_ACENE|nr:hypothetical protein LWI28_012736 [Acer negundo]
MASAVSGLEVVVVSPSIGINSVMVPNSSSCVLSRLDVSSLVGSVISSLSDAHDLGATVVGFHNGSHSSFHPEVTTVDCYHHHSWFPERLLNNKHHCQDRCGNHSGKHSDLC